MQVAGYLEDDIKFFRQKEDDLSAACAKEFAQLIEKFIKSDDRKEEVMADMKVLTKAFGKDDGYISKPRNFEDLYKTLASHIKKIPTRQQTKYRRVYLALLCWRHEPIARKFYKKYGVDYRPFIESEWEVKTENEKKKQGTSGAALAIQRFIDEAPEKIERAEFRAALEFSGQGPSGVVGRVTEYRCATCDSNIIQETAISYQQGPDSEPQSYLVQVFFHRDDSIEAGPFTIEYGASAAWLRVDASAGTFPDMKLGQHNTPAMRGIRWHPLDEMWEICVPLDNDGWLSNAYSEIGPMIQIAPEPDGNFSFTGRVLVKRRNIQVQAYLKDTPITEGGDEATRAAKSFALRHLLLKRCGMDDTQVEVARFEVTSADQIDE